MNNISAFFYLSICRILGWEFRHISEFSNLVYDSQHDFDKAIMDYKPDVIADINILRQCMPVDVPDSLFFFSYWDYPILLTTGVINEYECENINKRDYIFSPYLDIQKLDWTRSIEKLNLKEHIITFPFYPWQLKTNDVEKNLNIDTYTCDVAIFYNHKNPIKILMLILNINNNFSKKNMIIQFLTRLVCRLEMKINDIEGNLGDYLWVKKIVEEEISKQEFERYCLNFNKMIEWWTNYLIHDVLPLIYSNCVVDWLVDANLNLRIWGREWKLIPKYSNYAAGYIEEGTNELDLAYRGSKIVVDGCYNFSLHRRVFEAMREKVMVIQMQSNEDDDCSSWKYYFKENESIVIARNKTDLLKKINYYLKHEDARKRIVENAYSILMEKNFFNDDVLFGICEKIEQIVRG